VLLTAVEFFLSKTVRYVDLCENGPKMMCRMADCCHFRVCVVAEDGEMRCFVPGGDGGPQV
jgi:hypothetical protein